MLLKDVSQLKSPPGQPRTVIIGSGAVGLYAASELAKRGRHVVVIEAGQRHLGNFSPDSFASIGNPHSGIKLGRSRSLGGTTNLWGGQLVEFQPIDFDGRDWIPASRWPIRHSEIAPYYRKTYENLGFDEISRVDDNIWKAIGVKPPHLGSEIELFLTRWMRIPNFAELFTKQIEESDKLQVLTGCTAVGFRGDSVITGVRVMDEAGASHWIDGDTFILAAGTVENARLLLHAQTETTWPCPWRDNKNVGALFQDHLGGRIGVITPKDKKKFFDTYCTIVSGGYKYQPKMRLRNEIQERDQILNIQGIFAFESAASEHLVYLKQFLRAAVFSRKISGLGDFFRNAIGGFRYLVPLMWKYMWEHRVFVPTTSKVTLVVQAETEPCAKSRLTIDPSIKDRYGLPKVNLDWQLTGRELPSLRDFAHRIQAALDAAGLAKLDIEPDLLASKPEFLLALKDTIHQTGGAVMGTSPADGVVDRDLRVFGTQNLYVGGASTFRTNSNANVTFTALAFATRLVEYLTAKP